ncbi:hypothetical protein TNCV_1663151 [Trichonephila clavipes]|nr:hypothetical protein TNCV_1663151 [Trichonephila clavipes]
MYLWNDFGLAAPVLRWKRQRRLIRGWEERRRRRGSKERMERVKARECSNTHQGWKTGCKEETTESFAMSRC